MKVPIIEWAPGRPEAAVEAFLERPAFDDAAEDAAREVLARVRQEGNRAVLEFARKFDGVSLRVSDMAVNSEETAAAREAVCEPWRAAIVEAHGRIKAFARAGRKQAWRMDCPRGGSVGEQFSPLERVGVYVPGGASAAPLVSTALMTVTLARAAGVPEIVVTTSCDAEQRIHPAMLYALDVAGATEIYRVGGIQAVGLMAFGTQTVRKVQKIVGPGGTYVTAAKRQVYGHVALDLVAGPSEIAVLADDQADPRYVAADLLSQAEHGSGWERALLATPSMRLAKAVSAELQVQAMSLSRREAVMRVMQNGTLLAVVPSLDDGMALCNRFAPEHLELMVAEANKWLKKVTCAGGVFVGVWTPEAAGDFVAGPSHVLPTGGAAAMFSGLSVDDFRRRSSFVAFTRADLYEALPVIETFGEIEGLDAHARSAAIRFAPP